MTHTHALQVMGLFLAREEFQYKAGQYFFLNCPGLPGMEQEWHPFTISSSPFEDHLSAHISIMPDGSWTRALRDKINPDREKLVKFDAFLSAPVSSPPFPPRPPFASAIECD
jgi:NAD(P)H-flavin reductase